MASEVTAIVYCAVHNDITSISIWFDYNNMTSTLIFNY